MSEIDPKVQEFLNEYGELVKKHNIDFIAYPTYVPDGEGGFRTVIQQSPVDITNQPKPSPFVA